MEKTFTGQNSKLSEPLQLKKEANVPLDNLIDW